MPKIIASTYEILEEIGSGGGGIVYLGRHLRLNKKIVLKADRRNLTANPEHLRREVDALKNLSHTYIPQVYDFVQQDGVVYSVMDYIEGESLDRPLKRNERFKQSQVVEWACELLEALEYLHSYPPYGILHGDIKPANIMLTPRGDIRLIDFNIALALGEEGAVRVGYSQGYASPEHYGLNYTGMGETLRTREAPTTRPTRRRTEPGREPPASGTGGPSREVEPTELLHGKDQAAEETEPLAGNGQVTGGTELLGHSGDTEVLKDEEKSEHRRAVPLEAADSRGTSHTQGVLLDARSDIYSLGATLYHLLTGHCAPSDAREVRFIRDRDVSPAVAEIIYKAMAPDPDQRWQSAAEMRRAFEGLHENDPRVLRHRRHVRTTSLFLAALFLVGGLCTFAGLKQMEAEQEKAKLEAESAERALAAVSASEAAFRGGDIPAAVQQASAALELDSIYAPQAQRALTDALGVYDLTDGLKSHLLLPLPSEPTKAVLSPGGTRAAAITTGRLHVFDTETGETLAELPTDPSALSDVVFADEDMVLYAGDGALCAYDLAAQAALWTGRPATAITLSADRSTVAALYKDEDRAVVYRAASGEVLNTISFEGKHQSVLANDQFADPEDALFALNQDGSRLAVSFSDGALRLFDWSDPENCLTFFDSSDYVRFAGGFSDQYFAFSAAERSGASVFVVFDMNSLQQVGGLSAATPFLAAANESGVYVAQEDLLVRMELETASDSELAYTNGDILSYAVAEDYTLAASENGELTLFGAGAAPLMTYTEDEPYQILDLAGAYGMAASTGRPELRILKVENHTDAQIFTYDASVPHREARLSKDRNTVMLFQYDRFHLYDLDGTLLANEALPDASTIFDQQYRRDERGSYLEVTYYSGLVRCYSALDGSVISETTGTAPDPDAPIAYLTAHWRILAPQHGPPEVYDLESGALLGTLESSDYLTYVTQVGDFVITEYVTAQGLRYGLLLDDCRNTLARLPNLSDVLEDGTLVFDDQYGNLRQSRIYSIAELMALAKR